MHLGWSGGRCCSTLPPLPSSSDSGHVTYRLKLLSVAGRSAAGKQRVAAFLLSKWSDFSLAPSVRFSSLLASKKGGFQVNEHYNLFLVTLGMFWGAQRTAPHSFSDAVILVAEQEISRWMWNMFCMVEAQAECCFFRTSTVVEVYSVIHWKTALNIWPRLSESLVQGIVQMGAFGLQVLSRYGDITCAI